jgi:hypothetical protein
MRPFLSSHSSQVTFHQWPSSINDLAGSEDILRIECRFDASKKLEITIPDKKGHFVFSFMVIRLQPEWDNDRSEISAAISPHQYDSYGYYTLLRFPLSVGFCLDTSPSFQDRLTAAKVHSIGGDIDQCFMIPLVIIPGNRTFYSSISALFWTHPQR